MIQCLNCGKIASEENIILKKCPHCENMHIDLFFRIEPEDLCPALYLMGKAKKDLEWLYEGNRIN
jgi:predicted  nucleic acid-binding Zn-ribbon protein